MSSSNRKLLWNCRTRYKSIINSSLWNKRKNSQTDILQDNIFTFFSMQTTHSPVLNVWMIFWAGSGGAEGAELEPSPFSTGGALGADSSKLKKNKNKLVHSNVKSLNILYGQKFFVLLHNIAFSILIRKYTGWSYQFFSICKSKK